MLGLFVERGQSAVHLTVMNVHVQCALDAQNSHRHDRFEAPTLTTAKRPTHALSLLPRLCRDARGVYGSGHSVGDIDTSSSACAGSSACCLGTDVVSSLSLSKSLRPAPLHLLRAALHGYLDIGFFLVLRSGGPRVVNPDYYTMLTHFGIWTFPRPTSEEKQADRRQIRAAW